MQRYEVYHAYACIFVSKLDVYGYVYLVARIEQSISLSVPTNAGKEVAVQVAFYIVFFCGAQGIRTNDAACICILMHTHAMGVAVIPPGEVVAIHLLYGVD